MAITTPDLLKNLFTVYKSSYQDGLGIAPSQFNKIATVIQSNSRSNTYGWLGQFPQFQEWIDTRKIQSMEAYGYQITNKEYESTIGVRRIDIEDDNLGIYRPLFEEMGRAAAAHPDELVFSLLSKGDQCECFDNKKFFAKDHEVGGTSVSNVATGDKTPWYLLDTSRALKPLIYQERKKAEFISMTQEEDESVFMKNEYRYGVDSRCNVGFGFWQMAYMSQIDLNTDNFNDAYDEMTQYFSNEGRPLGIKPTTLVVPPALRYTAHTVMKEMLENGGDNPNAGIVEVIVSPWLNNKPTNEA